MAIIHLLISTIVCGIILYKSFDAGYPVFSAGIILIYFGQLIGIFEIRPTLSQNGSDIFEFKRIGFLDLNQYKQVCKNENRSLFWWWIEWFIFMLLMILFILFIVKVFIKY